MKPLRIEPPLLKLSSQHLDPVVFREAVESLSAPSIESIVRLWLTEGIPFAFRECPVVYDVTRAWLGSRLRVCPKEITLLGSARLGFSLAPEPEYGRAFGSKSDLDLSIVSESLFQELSKTFDRWHTEYRNGTVRPRHATEQRFWEQNILFGVNNIPRGFLDANKVPNLDRYPLALKLNQAMWELTQKLESTPDAPKARKASVRVYRSWRELVARVTFNLRVALARR